jgi:hypothetical protein
MGHFSSRVVDRWQYDDTMVDGRFNPCPKSRPKSVVRTYFAVRLILYFSRLRGWTCHRTMRCRLAGIQRLSSKSIRSFVDWILRQYTCHHFVDHRHDELRGQKTSRRYCHSLARRRDDDLSPSWLGSRHATESNSQWMETNRIGIQQSIFSSNTTGSDDCSGGDRNDWQVDSRQSKWTYMASTWGTHEHHPLLGMFRVGALLPSMVAVQSAARREENFFVGLVFVLPSLGPYRFFSR